VHVYSSILTSPCSRKENGGEGRVEVETLSASTKFICFCCQPDLLGITVASFSNEEHGYTHNLFFPAENWTPAQ